MFAHSAAAIDFADSLTELVRDQSKWSQKTFGSDEERGPLGALKHLELEAKEAQQAVDSDGIGEELADCLLLIIDASRRSGYPIARLIAEAKKKQAINQKREWPKPTDATTPVEHVR